MDRILKQGMILINHPGGRDTLILRPNGVFSCLLQSRGLHVQRSLHLPVETAESILEHLELLSDEKGKTWQVLLIYRDGRTASVSGENIAAVLTPALRTFLTTQEIELPY